MPELSVCGSMNATIVNHRSFWRFWCRAISFIFVGCSLVAHVEAHQAPGIVAKWSAEGNANDVIGDNEGRLFGDTSFAQGRFGRAFRFSALGDFIKVKDAPELTPRVITVECWFSATKTLKSEAFDIIPLVNKFHHNTAGPEEDSYSLGLTLDGGVRWQVDTFDGSQIFDNILQLQAGAVPGLNTLDGRLHHIAGTYDGALMVVYVDGVPLGSLPATGRVNDGPANLLFGAAFAFDRISWFQKGRLDQIRIYNRALSAAEIAAIARGS